MAPLMYSNYSATVVVTSDTCSKDPEKDTSGQYVVDQLKSLKFSRVNKCIIEDEKEAIVKCIKTNLEDTSNLLLITVGGTGLCPRDVTPEATSSLYERNCTGIPTALHLASLRYSSHAALSRLTAGIVGNCLIVNFPGKLKACKECFACLDGFLEHALEQVIFDAEAIKLTHQNQDLAHIKLESSRDEKEVVQIKQEVLIEKIEQEKCLISLPASPSSVDTNWNKIEPSILNLDTSIRETKTSTKTTEKMSHTEFNLKSHVDQIKEESERLELEYTQDESKPKIPMSSYPYSFVDFDVALGILKDQSRGICQESGEIHIDSDESMHKLLGQIIAEDLYSKSLIPPCPVSTMDGYVVNIPENMKKYLASIATIHPRLLSDVEEFEELQKDPDQQSSFFCYQVNTGGRVPNSVNQNYIVVPFESTGPKTVKNLIPIYNSSKIKLNQYVRLSGSDIDYEDSLKAGAIIGPIELSLLISMGYKSLKVVRKPTIGVLSTGDELVNIHDHTSSNSNQVVDVNGPLLSSFFNSKGYPVVTCDIAKDNKHDLKSKMETLLFNCDILIITGGASMGTKDYVKEVVERIGGNIYFGGVHIKPGKPAAFATLRREGKKKFIFSLPGNPVSAYITSMVLVLPFIEYGIRNHLGVDLPISLSVIGELIKVEIGSIIDSIDDQSYEFDGRLEFVRAKFLVTGERKSFSPYLVTISIRQQSSRLMSLMDCDCLVVVDKSQKGLKFLVGQTYQALKVKS